MPVTAQLDPRLLASTQKLALIARRLVSGAMAGVHPSRRPGISREFSQYRPYQPGDEPRHIDWKLFARSDRYFLRESEIDTRLGISVVLDATGSMQHPASSAEGARKFDRACALAAAFALLAEMQGDEISLHVVADQKISSVRSINERQHFVRIVHALAQVKPSGQWPSDARALTRGLRSMGTGDSSVPIGTTSRITVVLTDGHDQHGEIRASLAPLRARQHELLLIQLIAREEVDFPFRGVVRFEEWETGRVVEADATAVRSAYLAAETTERLAWKHAWSGQHFDYLRLTTDEPLDRGLRAYLRRRISR